MKQHLLAIAIVVAAIAATLIHHSFDSKPVKTLAVQGFFYEQSGLEINVPEGSVAEIYDEFVLITRPDGIDTMVPIHRIHAIDGMLN